MKLTFKHTQLACYLAYISQAITTTFLPLLFVRLGTEFGFSLTKLTVLITITFFTEIFIDAFCPVFIKKIGYRNGMIFANICAVIGTAGLAVFPFIFKNPYIGFILCDIFQYLSFYVCSNQNAGRGKGERKIQRYAEKSSFLAYAHNNDMRRRK